MGQKRALSWLIRLFKSFSPIIVNIRKPFVISIFTLICYTLAIGKHQIIQVTEVQHEKSTRNLLLSLLCLTTVFTAGISFHSKADSTAPGAERIYGTVNQINDNRLSITRQDGDFSGQELIITVSDETKILDAVNGYPVSLDSLRNGETIYAYIGPAMTMSLPPMTNSEMILCSIPADFRVPEYITVDTLTLNSDMTSGTIKADNGTVYTVPADASILPYLTRNIVTLSDLVKGRKCLIWTQSGSDTVTKITAFAAPAGTSDSDDSVKPYGWSLQDGS